MCRIELNRIDSLRLVLPKGWCSILMVPIPTIKIPSNTIKLPIDGVPIVMYSDCEGVPNVRVKVRVKERARRFGVRPCEFQSEKQREGTQQHGDRKGERWGWDNGGLIGRGAVKRGGFEKYSRWFPHGVDFSRRKMVVALLLSLFVSKRATASGAIRRLLLGSHVFSHSGILSTARNIRSCFCPAHAGFVCPLLVPLPMLVLPSPAVRVGGDAQGWGAEGTRSYHCYAICEVWRRGTRGGRVHTGGQLEFICDG